MYNVFNNLHHNSFIFCENFQEKEKEYRKLGEISEKFIKDLEKIGFSVIAGNGENTFRIEVVDNT